MVVRIRALFVSAALVAALGVVAVVQAQEVSPLGPDEATAAAISQWRTQSLVSVSPGLQDAVAAMYAGRVVDPSIVNEAAMAKMQAEAQAWQALDKSTARLIKDYFSQSVAESLSSGD
jgi:hypothetical protein